MAIGALWTVSLHNNGVTQILDNVEIESITDTSAVTGATVVKRITHDNGEHDAFVVQLVYAFADIGTIPTTFAATLTACTTAITAKYGAGALLV